MSYSMHATMHMMTCGVKEYKVVMCCRKLKGVQL